MQEITEGLFQLGVGEDETLFFKGPRQDLLPLQERLAEFIQGKSHQRRGRGKKGGVAELGRKRSGKLDLPDRFGG